jgi:hypothetical protein
MSVYRDSLITRRDAIASDIASLSSANYDLPNASGQTGIDFQGKIDSMYREMERLEVLIAQADGGYEIVSEVDT